jgi:hypothetical protein
MRTASSGKACAPFTRRWVGHNDLMLYGVRLLLGLMYNHDGYMDCSYLIDMIGPCKLPTGAANQGGTDARGLVRVKPPISHGPKSPRISGCLIISPNPGLGPTRSTTFLIPAGFKETNVPWRGDFPPLISLALVTTSSPTILATASAANPSPTVQSL